MFFKKKNDNNIDNNDKNAIDIKNVENNNNNNKKEKRKFKDSINKKYLKNGSYSSVMIVVFIAIIIVINMIVGNLPSKYTQLDIKDMQMNLIILRWNRKIQWSILNLSVNTPVTTFPLIA